MRVLVAATVPELLGPLVVGVAQVGRHLAVRVLAHVRAGVPHAERGAVALRRRGQVHHRLGEVELRLGQPDELHGAGRGIGHEQARRVGEADVLAGEDHQAAGDEASVLAGFEHAGEPVERGVRV